MEILKKKKKINGTARIPENWGDGEKLIEPTLLINIYFLQKKNAQ